MKLYEITQELEEFQAAVENGDIPPEAIADTMAGLNYVFEEKAENIACLIKNLAAEADAIKAEAAVLTERAQKKLKSVDFYKKYLTESFGAVGKDKYESARCAISFRKSEKVIITDETTFAQKFPDLCTTKTTVTPDKTQIKKLIKGGIEVAGAHLEESQNIQIK